MASSFISKGRNIEAAAPTMPRISEIMKSTVNVLLHITSSSIRIGRLYIKPIRGDFYRSPMTEVLVEKT